ncbi:tryptophan halogenase family protein [Simiduia agarivorans]|uniref:Tryptophan halogenase n=1 Tax=Simiduia agarivorans (strain DSM 21679 / JCM 13881 / BCRC 17597 / SA1) TaxID=1117647 RepID=K4KQI7_SIMAS|nr:tryptophan halogenase family protein [Simiduia agarivorans]AFV00531.1 tryptophan halogenase [Simiduia agarivorans SA1 = DSM 21679]
MENKAVRKVVIVGGGTAGWLTAGVLAARLRSQSGHAVSVTLVESPAVKTVGVGEGTWPSMRRTLKAIGVSETELIRRCNATFKQGAKFARWVTGSAQDHYYHPLIQPNGFHDFNLAPYWLKQSEQASFSAAVCPQDALCDAGLAPKKITTPEYAGIANYAYHLDAGAFADFLREHCVTRLDVLHRQAHVSEVRSDDQGDIVGVETNQGLIAGDFFIDCTGSQSLLLGQQLQVPFVCKKHQLFVDQALAVHVPYDSDDAPVASHTVSTAQSAGWIWDIGLQNRRGVGHVYSSAHQSPEMAERELMDYIAASGASVENLSPKHIAIHPGHRAQFWKNNCVAIGMSAGFLEPLEASAILLIEIAAGYIADQFPASRFAMEQLARKYNDTFLYRWERIIEFLKLHYVLSQRSDTAFWRDNRNAQSMPESLQQWLSYWREQSPWHGDFDRAVEVFPAASYQYVLYGMGFETRTDWPPVSEQSLARARTLFQQAQSDTNQLLRGLPDHRTLLNKIKHYGLQAV